ncbi:MAG: DUF5060 domain-containing protein [Candidatus Scalinduaceae bacterium]
MKAKKQTNMSCVCRLYFMLVIALSLVFGFISNQALGMSQVGLYDVWETQVINTNSYSNPFDYNEIELQATFTAPSNKQINFFGFHDGDGNGGQTGNVWKLRFMPDEIGTWTYTYTWTDGTPGGSGSFSVVDTELPGPLNIASDNPWYFMTARNEPFNFRGYTTTNGWWWSRSSQLFNNSIDEYLSDVDNHVIPGGYNMVMVDGPGFLARPGHNWWYFDGSNTDLDRFQIKTWTNEDRVINHYRVNEIYVFYFSLVGQGDVNATLGTVDRQKRFWRYYIARTGAFWNNLGNSLTFEWPESWSESTVNSWMSNPSNWNPFNTLLTSHDSMRASFDSWGGFSMRQLQSRNVFSGNTRTGGQHGGVQGSFVNKPIIASEDIWETADGTDGNPRNGVEVRRAAWGIMFAGVMPLYSEDWLTHPPAGGQWNGEGEPFIQIMFDFFYSKTQYRQYQQLNNLVSSSARQIASGIPGQEYLVYDEDGGSITIDLSGTASSDAFSVLWYDPKNGNEQNAGSVNGGASRTLTSPFSGDSVLLLSGPPVVQLPPPGIPDPSQWTERGVVIEKGPDGAWDANGNYVRVGAVVKKNGTYFLYYVGSSGAGCSDGGVDYRKIGVAISSDGINFTKYSGNPIITYQGPNSQINPCEEGAAFCVAALDNNGDVVMFWEAITAISATGVDGSVHYSTSSDGFNFTDHGEIPGLVASENWPVGVLHAQGGTSSGLTGKWHLWFMSDQFGPYSVWLATGDTPGSLSVDQNGPVISSIARAEWPVLHQDGTVSLFDASPGWSPSTLKVIKTTVDNLDTYSAPVITFPNPLAEHYTQVMVLPDIGENEWRMYYSDGDKRIRLRTAPMSVTDSTPPTTPQSVSATPQSESQIDLAWQAATDPESGIDHYNIYRDGANVGQSVTTTFSDTGLSEGTSYTYEVTAVNGAGLESAKSASVSATTLTDTTPPTITSVSASGNAAGVTVVFSEPVERTSAEDPSNYSIDNGITVSGASLGSDLKTITLITSPHSEGITYTVTVNNIQDRASAPNMITPDTQGTYTFAAQLVIGNLSAGSGSAYVVVPDGLQTGAATYIDRSFTFSTVPASVNGATYIQTANNDKSSTGTSFLTFDVNQNVTVYVGHDNRITTKPSWLAGFTDTGEDIVTTDTALRLFAKDFPAGAVTLGGNQGSGNSMYTVVILGQGSSSTPPDTTPPTTPTGLTVIQ